MKKLAIVILLSIFCINAYSQVIIKGIVLDGSTNIPVAYTNIGIEGTYFGTASNNEGIFELKIPEGLEDRTIFFSAVGFKNKSIDITALLQNIENIIRLEVQTYSINDIDILAESKVINRILRTANENIVKNFAIGPLYYNCIYEQNKIINNETKSIQGKLTIFDQAGYRKPSKLDAFVNRKYSFTEIDRNFEIYTLSDASTNIDEIIELDIARSGSGILNIGNLNTFELNMEEDTQFDNQLVWVINFKQTAPTFSGSGDFYATNFEGKIYINKNNFSILKIECQVKAPIQNKHNRSLSIDKNSNNFLTDISYNYLVLYNSNGLESITLNKNYLENEIPVQVSSFLKVESVSSSGINIQERDYYVEN